ncbi:MAG: damage-control phosphatase ARMT1 family protein [Thermoplasmata archaeon]
MKIRAECIPCLLGRVLYETNLVDEKLGLKVMAEACRILSEKLEQYPCVSSEVATEVHAKAYQIIGKDPYFHLKKSANNTAEEMVPEILEKAKTEINKFRFFMLCAVAGNTLDFGIKGGLRDVRLLKTRFWDIVNEGFGIDDSESIRRLIPGGKILYFTDNCGEIVFDRLLIEQIRELNPEYIAIVVKGEPVLSDATLEDAISVGIDKIADEILTTKGFAVGVNIHALGERLEMRIKEASLVIAKGMANYEALSETQIHPIAYLLKAKCAPVAESIGAKTGDNVAKLIT